MRQARSFIGARRVAPRSKDSPSATPRRRPFSRPPLHRRPLRAQAPCIAFRVTRRRRTGRTFSTRATSRRRDRFARSTRAPSSPAAAPASSDVSPSALALLARDHEGAPLLNANHYSPTDSVALSVLYDPSATGSPNYQLMWTDLHAADMTGSGVIARTGDPNAGISSPAWSHDGNTIAYVSADSSGEAVIANGGNIDIYTVPYNNRAGGAAHEKAHGRERSRVPRILSGLFAERHDARVQSNRRDVQLRNGSVAAMRVVVQPSRRRGLRDSRHGRKRAAPSRKRSADVHEFPREPWSLRTRGRGGRPHRKRLRAAATSTNIIGSCSLRSEGQRRV